MPATEGVTLGSGNHVSTVAALIFVYELTDVCAHLTQGVLHGPQLDYSANPTPIVGQGCVDIYA